MLQMEWVIFFLIKCPLFSVI